MLSTLATHNKLPHRPQKQIRQKVDSLKADRSSNLIMEPGFSKMDHRHELLMARNMRSNHTAMQDKYCGHYFDIHCIQNQYKNVAAVDRHYSRGGAAFGRVTSFVISFVSASNKVNDVAMITILVLHVGVIGHHVPCHEDFISPFYFRTTSKKWNSFLVYSALPARKWIRPRSTFGDGVVTNKNDNNARTPHSIAVLVLQE